ncbi:hypothetical protein BaRGS_00028244, partial [Batillaria attramentaria]
CQSVSPPICGQVCAIYCPNGNVLDQNGCPTCACKPDTTQLCPLCFNYCPNGRELRSDGCPSCTCKQAPQPVPSSCGRVLCRNFCFNGRALDDQGCETCNCRSTSLTISTLSPSPQCGRVLCRNFCFNGRTLDSQGCETCVCKTTGCPLGLCRNYCPNGRDSCRTAAPAADAGDLLLLLLPVNSALPCSAAITAPQDGNRTHKAAIRANATHPSRISCPSLDVQPSAAATFVHSAQSVIVGGVIRANVERPTERNSPAPRRSATDTVTSEGTSHPVVAVAVECQWARK